jgi:hypothetical protein
VRNANTGKCESPLQQIYASLHLKPNTLRSGSDFRASAGVLGYHLGRASLGRGVITVDRLPETGQRITAGLGLDELGQGIITSDPALLGQGVIVVDPALIGQGVITFDPVPEWFIASQLGGATVGAQIIVNARMLRGQGIILN